MLRQNYAKPQSASLTAERKSIHFVARNLVIRFRALYHVSPAPAQLSLQHLQTRRTGHSSLLFELMTISDQRQIRPSFCWCSFHPDPSACHGAQHTTRAPCGPTTRSSWKEPWNRFGGKRPRCLTCRSDMTYRYF